MKAHAAKRNINLGTRRRLLGYVLRLSKEMPQWRMQEAFAMAETLHLNFREDNLPGETVKVRADAVKSLVEELKTGL